MGSGFINDNSKIRVRVISDNANDKFDEAFWERRVKYALEYRKTVMGKDFDCCRLIFGEADKFPGLTVDRFGSVLVTQCLSLGIDNIKDMLFPIIVRTLRNMGETIEVLYERNDVKIREKEGMEEYKAFYEGEGLLTDTDGKTIIEENGIKYNRENGSVHVRVRQEDDTVVIDVEDTGSGIPENALESIFNRFYRVDKARSRQAGGAGLGLSIVHEMVGRNFGTITVRSTVGEGSCFTVTFPSFGSGEEGDPDA